MTTETAASVADVFESAGSVVSSRFEREEIIAFVLQTSKSKIYSDGERRLTPRERVVIEGMLQERAQGQPLAYVLGSQEFYFETFLVDPRVLIPRPESEVLVETAENFLKENPRDSIRILDLGAGSGCLGLSLAKRFPQARVTLVEMCGHASALCLQNIFHLGLEDRAELLHRSARDFLSSCQGTFDVILANPPYIGWKDDRVDASVLNFEPHGALFSDEEGFYFIREWATLGRPRTRSEGMMIFEMGIDHGDQAFKLFNELRFHDVQIVQDLSQRPRFIVGLHHG